jgi:phosphatidylglycerol:prolipoprotein diacylglycerol transferase
MWNLVGFLLILVLFLKVDKRGIVTSFYLIFYGMGRAFIEGLRTDSLYISTTNIRVSQVLSIAMVIAGIGMLIYYYKKQNNKYKLPKS